MRQNKVHAVLQAILSTCFICGTLASAQGPPAATQTPEKPQFSYSGDDGPGFWAQISPAWRACGNAEQSPVDIIPGNAVVDPALTLTLDLEQTSVVMFNDDGHTIKVEYAPGTGGTIRFNGVDYEIRQFHFHTLSEHTFQGKRGLMELHAVFQVPKTENYVAIAMLYEIGNENAFLSKLISAGLPKKSYSRPVIIPALQLANAFTEISSYYNYAGSLTIPSCFPVTFIVLKTEATMSEEQFLAFQGILGNNFRPIQALNDREVRVTPSD
jgi:carbonic anhydrase